MKVNATLGEARAGHVRLEDRGGPGAGFLVFSSGLFLLLCLQRLLLQLADRGQPAFVDDAYYYFLIARNWITVGMSTFDGTHLTNGYHPLWMGVLLLQYKCLGESLTLTRSIEFFLALTGLAATLKAVRIRGLAASMVFTAGYFVLMTQIALNGMETTIFACCFGLLIYSLGRSGSSVAGLALLDGGLAALAVASRLDAAVFVLPLLLLTAHSWVRKGIALAVVAVSCLVYMLWNHHVFGAFMPISGEVKSLGGMQLNHPLLHAMASPRALQARLFYLTLLAVPVSVWLWLRSRGGDELSRTEFPSIDHPSIERPLLGAFVLGFFMFAMRLFLFSSWTIWPWYDYPVLLAYMGCVPALLRWIESRYRMPPQSRFAASGAAIVLLLLAVLTAVAAARRHTPRMSGYFAVNEEALALHCNRLRGASLAMGDRAGQFAYLYPGPVEQMEGLANDHAYLDLLKSKGDVRAKLCADHIQYLAAYAPDLGSYDTYAVDPIRAKLSQYRPMQIRVRREDQVAKVYDLSRFDDRKAGGDGNSYLYIWKLPCR